MNWKPAVAFIAACLAPLASATSVAPDPSGDVQGNTPAGPAIPEPIGAFPYIDITDLIIEETDTELQFTIQVVSTEGAKQRFGSHFQLNFQHETTEFQLVLAVPLEPPPFVSPAQAALTRRPTGSENFAPAGNVTVTESDTGYTISIPRTTLADEEGIVPGPGRSLTGITLTSDEAATEFSAFRGFGAELVIHYQDHAQGTDYPIQIGQASQGTARLSSPKAMRSSNGEAGTFAYDFYLENEGPTTATYSLAATQVPTGWDVSIPIAAYQLEPKQRVHGVVITAVPFNHIHGSQDRFHLEATNIKTGTIDATIALGVAYLTIPQPSGHHPTTYIHTAAMQDTGPGSLEGVATEPYMNNVEDDGIDTHAAIAPIYFDAGENPTNYIWCIRLDPALKLGLHAKDEDGLFSGRFHSTLPMDGAISGRLLVSGRNNDPTSTTESDCLQEPGIHFATIQATSANLPAGGTSVEVNAPITVATPGIQVPDGENQNLVLELTYSLARPGGLQATEGLVMDPGATMRLALEEYHEVYVQPESNGARLTSEGPLKVARAPGKAAVFSLQIEGPQGNYDLSRIGTNSAWLSLPATASPGRPFNVGVVIPSDAVNGQEGNIIIQAVNKDSATTALARIVVTVDDQATEDDSDLLGSTKSNEAPSLAASLLIAALAMITVTQRRRV